MRGLVIGIALMLSTQMVYANADRVNELTEEAQQVQLNLQRQEQIVEQLRQRLIGIVAIINEYSRPIEEETEE